MVLVREVISEEHRVLFPFESFNRMQSVLLPQLLGSDENMVVAAPTGSGKTVVHELAILRCYLQKAQEDQDKGKGNDNSRIKCVSIMPNKALCQQVCMYVCMYVCISYLHPFLLALAVVYILTLLHPYILLFTIPLHLSYYRG